MNNKMSFFVLGFLLALFSVGQDAKGAEWLGTGGDTLWGTAANWEGEIVPEGAISFTDQAGDNKTVTLDKDYMFAGAAVIEAGTPEAPFIFTAFDKVADATSGLDQTVNGNLSLTGALKVEKGIWNFANDILPNGGYLHLTGGRVTTQYWMPVSGDTTIIVDDGALVMAIAMV